MIRMTNATENDSCLFNIMVLTLPALLPARFPHCRCRVGTRCAPNEWCCVKEWWMSFFQWMNRLWGGLLALGDRETRHPVGDGAWLEQSRSCSGEALDCCSRMLITEGRWW